MTSRSLRSDFWVRALLMGGVVAWIGGAAAACTNTAGSGSEPSGSGIGGAGGETGGIMEPQGTSLFIEVYDKVTGVPVSGAYVAVNSTFLQTDNQGHVLFENLQPGRVVARIYADGYARSSVVAELTEGVHGGQVANLLSLGKAIPFEAEQGATLTKDNVHVTIKPGSLVDENKTVVTGTVDLTIAPINPTTDELIAMPGPLEGIAEGSTEREPLISIFMAEVSLWQNGKPLQLAPGTTARLEFVLPDAFQSDYTIDTALPAWWFDPDSGLWIQEGSGTIQNSVNEPGKLAWVAEVGHFTFWNCDDTWDFIKSAGAVNCYNVTVVDSNQKPVPGMKITTEYAEPNISGQKFEQTKTVDANANVCIEFIGINPDNTFAKSKIYVGNFGSPLTAPKNIIGTKPPGICPAGPCTPMTLTYDGCNPGATQTCPYSGLMGTENVGACKAAKKTCGANGQWSACTGEVTPATEICKNSIDEDCNGKVNNGCEGFCTPNAVLPCYTGLPPSTENVGKCKGGTATCNPEGTNIGPCMGEVTPLPVEDCTTPDDDNCNGLTNLQDSMTCKCVPAEVVACYEGPLGTQNVGICQGGMKTCNPQGTNFGACVGATVPGAENCNLSIVKDEDCDGNVNEGCPNASMMSKIFGDAGNQFASSVAVDASENIFIAGRFFNQVNFGGGALTASGVAGDASDAFVAKFNSTGTHLWSMRLGDATGQPIDDQSVTAIAVDTQGNVVIVGTFSASIAIGATSYLTPVTSVDGFIAKLSAGNGSVLWSGDFNVSGTADSLQPLDVAIDQGDANSVLVAGSFNGSFPCGAATCTSTVIDIMTRKYTTNGAITWTKTFGGAGNQEASGVAVDSTSKIFITGSYDNSFKFGSCSETLTNMGSKDALVAQIDKNGNCIWRQGYGGAEEQIAIAVAVNSANEAIVTGHFKGTLGGAGNACLDISSPTTYDVFAARLSGSNGACQWRQRYGVQNDQFASDIAVDNAGNILLAGFFKGRVSFDAAPATNSLLSPGGGFNMYLSKLTSSGAHVWSWSYDLSDSDDQIARSIAIDPANSIVLLGEAKGTINFGDTMLKSSGLSDVVLTKLQP